MKSFSELVKVIEETGEKCPWDREQTIESLTKHLKEEAEEVLHAVKSDDTENLKEELGDLLWIILMMADIARKEKKFTVEDVLAGLKEKIIRRHPHVFGDKKAKTAEDAIRHFNEAKKNERKKRNK